MEKNTKKNAYSRVYVHDRPLSRVQLFATSRTVACQAPLLVEFSREEDSSWLPFPFPGNLPDPGIELGLLYHSQILYHLSHQGVF